MWQPCIIVIEDDLAVNEGVVMILEKSGYTVRAFLTADAFEKLESEPADIYLIDRHLKGADGLELCRRLKSRRTTEKIPIVIMSASLDTQKYIQQAGGDAFLEKPFSKKQLLAVIAQFISPGTGNR